MSESYGKLYIVSTPIGNLLDITFRAINTLKNVDVIACEDTRHTRELLNHFEIKTKTISCHEHNEYEKSSEIISLLKEGKDVALVTDAGTPIISDPGNTLVKNVIDEGILVSGIPGACAAINALVVSGINAKSFLFVGFLPNDNKKKKERLDLLTNETNTMIFYIPPHGFIKDITSLIETFGDDRCASLSREMTKIHEENVYGTLKSIKEHFAQNEIKGEMVLVVSGIDIAKKNNAEKEKWLSMSIEDHMKHYIDKGLSEKDAMKRVASDRMVDKRDIYKILKVKE